VWNQHAHSEWRCLFGAGTLTSSPTGTVIYNQQSNETSDRTGRKLRQPDVQQLHKTLARAARLGLRERSHPDCHRSHHQPAHDEFQWRRFTKYPRIYLQQLDQQGGGVARILTLSPPSRSPEYLRREPISIRSRAVPSNTTARGANAPGNIHHLQQSDLDNVTTVAGFAGLTVQGCCVFRQALQQQQHLQQRAD